MRPLRFVESVAPACRFPRPTLDCCVSAEAALALAADAERAGERAIAAEWERWALEVEAKEREVRQAREEAERAKFREDMVWQARRYGL